MGCVHAALSSKPCCSVQYMVRHSPVSTSDCKLQDSTSRILYKNQIYIINIVVACVLTCQLLRSLLWLSYVVIRTLQLKRVWKRRRARSVLIFFVEIVAQLVSKQRRMAQLSLNDECASTVHSLDLETTLIEDSEFNLVGL